MGSPGPATLSLAAVGAAYGARAGSAYLLGIVAGTFAVLILIATGVTGIILAVPTLVFAISVAAALYILYLAYRIATAPVISQRASNGGTPTLAGGCLLAIANPKAFAAIGAVYSGHMLVAGSVWLDTVAKIGALTLVIVVVNVTWLIFGSLFARHLQNPRIGRIANITFAVLLVLSVALAFSEI